LSGAWLAVLVAAAAPTLASPQARAEAELPTAPDGRRGLGSSSELPELLALFRKPTREDREFLGELLDLEPRLRVLVSTTEGLYRDRGFLDLVPRGEEKTLERLHRLHGEVADEPGLRLERVGRKGRIWAELLLDPRIWMRIEVLQGWERDARDLRLGLGVLRAVTDGWVRLDAAAARTIAKRVDLAAALLRARLLDLSALRETTGASSEIADEDRERFLSFLAIEDDRQRDHLLSVELETVGRRVAAMRGVLFTHRLELQAAELVHERREGGRQLEELRPDVRLWQPQTPEGKKAPSDIRRIKKTARRREAYRLALQGLRYDPLDEEMAYTAGLMAQFVAGTYESLSYFDRFLALRSIRSYDDRNWRKRKLTEEESTALFQIQQFESEEFPRPGGGG